MVCLKCISRSAVCSRNRFIMITFSFSSCSFEFFVNVYILNIFVFVLIDNVEHDRLIKRRLRIFNLKKSTNIKEVRCTLIYVNDDLINAKVRSNQNGD